VNPRTPRPEKAAPGTGAVVATPERRNPFPSAPGEAFRSLCSSMYPPRAAEKMFYAANYLVHTILPGVLSIFKVRAGHPNRAGISIPGIVVLKFSSIGEIV
jgi:hypothetical protein